MRVMQLKYNQRVKMNQVNSREPFALNFTNTGTVSNKGAFVGQRWTSDGKRIVGYNTNPSSSCCDNDVVISQARGKWIQKEIGKIKPWVISSFHPAFLMRQPEQKKLSWIDLKMIKEKLKIL